MAKLDLSDTTKPDSKVQKWLQNITEALEREKDFRKNGRRVEEIYELEKPDEIPFNVLYSNTETLAPALYNNTPRPVVQRRFKDSDALGAIAAKLTQRTLEYQLDSGDRDTSAFDEAIQQAVLEALVPGRGLTRFKYEAQFAKIEGTENEAAEGEEAEVSEQVTYECVGVEEVPWNRFVHGYAKRWADVPWIAFEHFMTREELVENFKELGRVVPLSVGGSKSDCDNDREDSRPADSEGEKFARVWEIWDKVGGRKVTFIADSYPEAILRETEDPLELEGFYPIPRPLQFFQSVKSLLPKPLYLAYENQAKELNTITVRINKIVRALKVRGFYDGTIEGLERLMTADDNTLLPAQNIAALAQGMTLEKAIWLLPLDKLIVVLQQLYTQRQQVKQIIYEITGISDILRGASVASETATAQNIKNQWGTLRLKRMQKLVSVYVRNSLRIMAEIAINKFSPETLMQMTGMKLPTQEQQQQAQVIVQQAQMMQQPLPPELQQILSLPPVESVLEILRNDLQRSYRIDIETNSTVDTEATEDKELIGEFLNAIAQFMNGVAPMIQEGILPFEAAKAMLLAVVRRFRFGTDVEEQLAQMQAPQQPQGPDPKQLEQQQAEMQQQGEQLQQAQQQLTEQQQALQEQSMQMEAEFKQQQQALRLEKMEIDFAKKELQFQQRELQLAAKQAQLEIKAAAAPTPEPANA